jgi:hypothetical protein
LRMFHGRSLCLKLKNMKTLKISSLIQSLFRHGGLDSGIVNLFDKAHLT